MATTQDHTPPRVIHHAPGDRPLCGNESSTAIYSDDPSRVAGCEDCLELVAEGPEEPRLVPRRLRELLAGDLRPGRSCLAAGGPGTLPLLRPRGLVSMTTPTANWPELLKAVVLEVLGANPQTPG